ncbi:sugar transferase [Secundilactobacillus mixtipabuli]|uniref:Sugar transferase n=1 Tax=Secundilactobacillus mixtipabuli TaxID=1435342 RepID=A0A1Z5IC54_9LACO|nr:sugar transferase [Secundilactobacillus mixtipabuli]GAW99218.1 sugar transferase [Secundilactobacillus mixtipabuli]
MQAGSKSNHLGLLEDPQVLQQEKIDHRYGYRIIKIVFDKVFSLIALIFLIPVFLIVAVLIKIDDSKGPVFYSQIRIGRNGHPFKMYKFRSMIVDADKKFEKVVDKNEVDGAMFKMKNDPRITHIGRIIRKYSVDELPQLLNVLKGDMALVGPRPPLEREIKQYTEYDKQRLLVTPGCTGLWQVTARNSVGFHEMIKLDIKYIQKSGVLFDFYILCKTVEIIIKPNNAY